MADVDAPLIEKLGAAQNGIEETKDKLADNADEKPTDNLLLQKLLEQNR